MEDFKAFQIRIPHELWAFLKKAAYEQEVSMNHIITRLLEKYQKSYKK